MTSEDELILEEAYELGYDNCDPYNNCLGFNSLHDFWGPYQMNSLFEETRP